MTSKRLLLVIFFTLWMNKCKLHNNNQIGLINPAYLTIGISYMLTNYSITSNAIYNNIDRIKLDP